MNGTKFLSFSVYCIVTVSVNVNVVMLFVKSLSVCLGAVLTVLIISVNVVQNNVSSNGAVSELACQVHINTAEKSPRACSDPKIST